MPERLGIAEKALDSDGDAWRLAPCSVWLVREAPGMGPGANGRQALAGLIG